MRASLLRKGLARKSVNNVLCVLSKTLRYAVDVELIEQAPKLGLLNCERPEIEPWSCEEYARLVSAAHAATTMDRTTLAVPRMAASPLRQPFCVTNFVTR